MPELIEVEMFRAAAEAVVGRTVSRVDAPDSWFLKHGLSADVLGAAVPGAEVLAATRRGKLLMMPMSSGPRLPWRSLSGPARSCPSPRPSMHTDIDTWASASVVSSESASSGNDGM